MKQNLSLNYWNGVRLYDREPNSSWRAILTTVAEERYKLFVPYVEERPKSLGVRELKPHIYFEMGTQDEDYVERRMELIRDSGWISVHEAMRLDVHEVTAQIAQLCLKRQANGEIVFPHPDGIY